MPTFPDEQWRVAMHRRRLVGAVQGMDKAMAVVKDFDFSKGKDALLAELERAQQECKLGRVGHDKANGR